MLSGHHGDRQLWYEEQMAKDSCFVCFGSIEPPESAHRSDADVKGEDEFYDCG